MSTSYSIVCVKWGTKYGPDYVSKLQNMVRRHCTIDYQFICLTDDPVVGVECLELVEKNVQGWWNKLLLFHPEQGLDGTVLFFDLDMLIYDNIDDLLTWGSLEDFTACRDFLFDEIGGCTMRFQPEKYHFIWDRWNEKGRPNIPHGDQKWITDQLDSWNPLPDQWVVSYKVPDRANRSFLQTGHYIPEGSKVMAFHGKPKPHEVATDFVLENWY